MSVASAGPVQVVDNPRRHRYEARRGDQLLGFVTYQRQPGRITFLHTETEPAVQGQGVGGELAAGALDDARAQGLTVTPLCPFVADFIERHPNYRDLVAPGS